MVENIPSDMLAHRRLKLACASTQSDQSPRYPYEATLHLWVSQMLPGNAQADLTLHWAHMSEGTFSNVVVIISHYETTLIQIYRKFYLQTPKFFRIKTLIFFLFQLKT